VKTQPHGIQKPELIVHETFDEVRRQLQDCVARMRGNVKLHEQRATETPSEER
jgi:hypothetical protein